MPSSRVMPQKALWFPACHLEERKEVTDWSRPEALELSVMATRETSQSPSVCLAQ